MVVVVVVGVGGAISDNVYFTVYARCVWFVYGERRVVCAYWVSPNWECAFKWGATFAVAVRKKVFADNI